ncbi:MAG: RNA polymerase sigma factor [Candidatus Riflebacteria bacterium]|jgi:RNA polymerase sigma factor (sigma-70 family)|nr:RNA polymerase sigma factor [Candidatus Riflebacteria bacterium]MDD3000207.1 RNA polymerase sigma factor [Candidatus Riflebacteria bacterium]
MSRQEKSDVELVKLVLSGECEAYSALVQRYEKLVFSFLLSRMNSIHDIEDIVQDSFVKAYKHLASFDCERKFSAWLLTIARNIMIDSRRKSSRDLPSTDLVNDVLLTDSAKEESEQPADILIRRERFRKILMLIRELPEEFKTPFLLRIVNEMSYQDIADSIGIPLQTVKNRIFKARTLLREKREKKDEMPN